MKYNIGDRVKFLNEAGEGSISKIIDNDTVYVLGVDGFEIPYPVKELLIIENIQINYSAVSEKKIEEAPKKIVEIVPEYTKSEEVNLYFAFVPKNQSNVTDSELKAYLINDSNYFIFYNIAKKSGENYKSITGILEPNMKNVYETFHTSDVDEKIDINIQLIFFDKKAYKLREPFSKFIKISEVKFFKQNSFSTNDFFDEFAMIVPILEDNAMQKAMETLTESEIEKVKSEKEKTPAKKEFKKPEDKSLKEVDLHLHELIDNEEGLSDHEKLQIQIGKFNTEMRSAIKEKYEKIVFIHGVGNGTLKLEIRRELQRVYRGYQFQDASFREYGFGATMVLLR
jgi:hypothetical protein